MKATMIRFIIFFLGYNAITTAAFAQEDTSNIKSLPPVTITSVTKKVPPQVWFGLSLYFPEAENPRWYALNKDYLVKFMIYTQENRVLLSRKGKVIYHISYGYENSLPADVNRQVRTAYIDYEVYRAIRIKQANRVVWVINLQDAKELVMVRVEDDQLEEIQRLTKAL